MKKIGIFIDLNGVLLNSDNSISNLDKKVIQKVKDTHNVYLNTGMSEINSIRYYNELNLDTKLITSIGHVISNPSDKNYKPIIKYIDVEGCFEIIEEIKQKYQINNYLLESTDGNCYIKNKDLNNHLIRLIFNKNYE